MNYNPKIVIAWFKANGLSEPVAEYRFAPPRKWRFDFAWEVHRLALEVQGGIFTNGRHTRGAALLKEMEKLNTAAAMGYRVLYVVPSELCMPQTVEMVKAAMKV